MMLDRLNNSLHVTMTDEETQALDDHSFFGLAEILRNYFATRITMHNQRKMEEFFAGYNALSTGDRNAVHGIINSSKARNQPRSDGSDANVG